MKTLWQYSIESIMVVAYACLLVVYAARLESTGTPTLLIVFSDALEEEYPW